MNILIITSHLAEVGITSSSRIKTWCWHVWHRHFQHSFLPIASPLRARSNPLYRATGCTPARPSSRPRVCRRFLAAKSAASIFLPSWERFASPAIIIAEAVSSPRTVTPQRACRPFRPTQGVVRSVHIPEGGSFTLSPGILLLNIFLISKNDESVTIPRC